MGCQGSKMQGPREPVVKLKVGDQIIDFIVGTGAEISAVAKPVAVLSQGRPLLWEE